MLITINEKEIQQTPNDAELGSLVREKWFDAKKYLEYDSCVICGKISPYKTTQHIDTRIGYVEGAGQGCFQPSRCKA